MRIEPILRLGNLQTDEGGRMHQWLTIGPAFDLPALARNFACCHYHTFSCLLNIPSLYLTHDSHTPTLSNALNDDHRGITL